MLNISNWEMVEVSDDLNLDVEVFDFACCGNMCGGGGAESM